MPMYMFPIFVLLTPHCLEIGGTFDFDTRIALKQIERVFFFPPPHQLMPAAVSLPPRRRNGAVE